MSGDTDAIVPLTIVPVLRLGTHVAFPPKQRISRVSKKRQVTKYLPFLSSTVTVSFWHFMRNLAYS